LCGRNHRMLDHLDAARKNNMAVGNIFLAQKAPL
jgi:hypothetical protein